MEVTFPRQKHRNRTSAKVIWLIIALYYYLYKITEQFVDFQFTFLFMHIIPSCEIQTSRPDYQQIPLILPLQNMGPIPLYVHELCEKAT